MKKCPYCGAQISDDSLFCTECGKQIPLGSVCPHCGAGMNEGDVFCQSCGKKADESPSTEISDLIQKTCPYCGSLVNDGDVFCENCGRNLSDGSIGFTPNEIQLETYVEEESSAKKILPIILGVLAIVLIGVGAWYWISQKKGDRFNPSTNSIVQKGDSINEADILTIGSDSIIEVVDSIMNDEYFDEYGADTVATDNYGRYNDAEEDYLENVENTHSDVDPNVVLNASEEMPQFPGGQSAMLDYLAKNINYPVVAEENGIQGKVIVTFVVERDGSITEVKIAKSVDPSLDKEAVRIVESMPRWKPGKQKGVTVRVKYTVPVQFRLN